MFTGIVEYHSTYLLNNDILIFKNDNPFWNECALGDSICVNGVCLTIRSINDKTVEFDLLETTKRLTNLTMYTLANLEKSLIHGKSLVGGHYITGHVIETGVIKTINSNVFTICVTHYQRLKYKDSISVNGISLTITNINENNFSFEVIPHTLTSTNLHSLKPGDLVNIEYNSYVQNDEYFMELALTESLKGRYNVSPNPWVGCVIVNELGMVVSTGHHARYSDIHAEEMAIRSLDKTHHNLTLYTTLEPCSNWGNQPPCCNRIVETSAIKHVVVGITDPDSRVNGKGIEYLKQNGITVKVNILADKIKESLASYIFYKTVGRPYVVAKIALSSDGMYCVPGENVSICNCEHTKSKLRAESDCIIIGSRTAVIDNPRLTVRNHVISKQPLRVIIDSHGIVKSSNLMCKGTIMVTTKNVGWDTLKFWESNDVEYIVQQTIDIEDLLVYLANKYNVVQCLLEGGGELQSIFDNLNLINKIITLRSVDTLPSGLPWRVNLEKYNNGNSVISDIKYAVNHFKSGMVIVMDDVTRENEGDIIVHADVLTQEMLTFIKNNTTGIICVTLNEKRALELNLPLQVVNNQDPHNTAFTVTCDSINCTTGVSSSDRLLTIQALLDGDSSSITKPGHIFPLIARKGGLSVRRGHTEASIDLCKLAGLKECSVICELTNQDGTMMRRSDIHTFAKKHNLPVITTQQIYELGNRSGLYLNIETIPETIFQASCQLETRDYGTWQLSSYNSVYGTIKVVSYNLDTTQKIMVRIHSECFTGDILHSSHCDCGEQLSESFKLIKEYNNGLIIFPSNHEGRGIGFTNKIRAYTLINSGVDTYKANEMLGFKDDLRDYGECISIFKSLGVKSMVLLTSNPDKIKCTTQYFKVEPRLLVCGLTKKNEMYMHAKSKRHGTFRLNSSHEVSKKIAIVHSMWYIETMGDYINKLCTALNIESVYGVPGCFEIPLKIQQIIGDYDLIIAVGAIIKGETYHFECISHTITEAIMNIQLKYNKPVVNNILNAYTFQQVEQRFSDPSSIIDTVKYLN